MTNVLLLIYALTSSVGLVLLKLGGKTGPPIAFVDNRLHFNLGAYAISGLFFYAFSFLLYAYLISKNDLSYVIPVSTALVYLFIFLASFFLFKEAFTAIKIAGICLIMGGVILLNIHH